MKMSVLSSRKEKKSYSLYGKMSYKNAFEFPSIHSRDARYFYHSDYKNILLDHLLLEFVKTNKRKLSETTDKRM